MKKAIYWFKILALILSVYFGWIVILGSSYDDSMIESIPFTILTIYVWTKINK